MDGLNAGLLRYKDTKKPVPENMKISETAGWFQRNINNLEVFNGSEWVNLN